MHWAHERRVMSAKLFACAYCAIFAECELKNSIYLRIFEPHFMRKVKNIQPQQKYNILIKKKSVHHSTAQPNHASIHATPNSQIIQKPEKIKRVGGWVREGKIEIVWWWINIFQMYCDDVFFRISDFFSMDRIPPCCFLTGNANFKLHMKLKWSEWRHSLIRW